MAVRLLESKFPRCLHQLSAYTRRGHCLDEEYAERFGVKSVFFGKWGGGEEVPDWARRGTTLLTPFVFGAKKKWKMSWVWNWIGS